MATHRKVKSERMHNAHHAPSRSQLFEYATFQLNVSRSHRTFATSGPNSTRTAVSWGGTLLRNVIIVGRDSVDSKLTLAGDEGADTLMSNSPSARPTLEDTFAPPTSTRRRGMKA